MCRICESCGQKVKVDLIENIDEAFLYAKNRLRKFTGLQVTINDILNDSYVGNGFSKKKMSQSIFDEYRRNKTEKIDSKVCTNCNENKPVAAFYLRVDYRVNFQYCIQPCKECHKDLYKQKKASFVEPQPLS